MGTIFSDSDIRVHVGDAGSIEHIWNVGKAFAEWLPEEGSFVIVKSQAADKSTVSAFTEGLLLQGRTVIDAGEGGLEVVHAALGENKAAGAAMLDYSSAQDIASISLYDSRGMAISLQTGLSEINELVDAGNFLPSAKKGIVVVNDKL